MDTVSLEVGLWATKALCSVGCVSPLHAESEGRDCVSVVIYQQSGWCHSLCHYVVIMSVQVCDIGSDTDVATYVCTYIGH